MRLGPWEIVILLIIILLLFGAKRLPELAKSLGRSLSEFKRGREESLKDGTSNGKDETTPPAKPG